jgi:hypothetical protein
LYRLDRDPAETTNLVDKQPEMVSRLLAQLHAFRRLKLDGIPHFLDGREGFVAPKDWKITD